MAYTIHKSDGTLITVADNAIDNDFYNSTGGSNNNAAPGLGAGVRLIGRNTIDYGTAIAQNFVQMTENFASVTGTQPVGTVALQGQLWFDKTLSQMYVRTTPGAIGADNMSNWTQLLTIPAGYTTFSPVNKNGDTMLGALVLNADPTVPLGAATKQYVDNVALTAGTGISIAGHAISLANTAVVAGTYVAANITVDAQGRITSASNGGGGSGSVTSITAGTGLTGGTITSTGTIALANTAVTAGSYTSANITVDAQGRITSATNGSGGGGGGTIPVVGGTIPIPDNTILVVNAFGAPSTYTTLASFTAPATGYITLTANVGAQPTTVSTNNPGNLGLYLTNSSASGTGVVASGGDEFYMEGGAVVVSPSISVTYMHVTAGDVITLRGVVFQQGTATGWHTASNNGENTLSYSYGATQATVGGSSYVSGSKITIADSIAIVANPSGTMAATYTAIGTFTMPATGYIAVSVSVSCQPTTVSTADPGNCGLWLSSSLHGVVAAGGDEFYFQAGAGVVTVPSLSHDYLYVTAGEVFTVYAAAWQQGTASGWHTASNNGESNISYHYLTATVSEIASGKITTAVDCTSLCTGTIPSPTTFPVQWASTVNTSFGTWTPTTFTFTRATNATVSFGLLGYLVCTGGDTNAGLSARIYTTKLGVLSRRAGGMISQPQPGSGVFAEGGGAYTGSFAVGDSITVTIVEKSTTTVTAGSYGSFAGVDSYITIINNP